MIQHAISFIKRYSLHDNGELPSGIIELALDTLTVQVVINYIVIIRFKSESLIKL